MKLSLIHTLDGGALVLPLKYSLNHFLKMLLENKGILESKNYMRVFISFLCYSINLTIAERYIQLLPTLWS